MRHGIVLRGGRALVDGAWTERDVGIVDGRIVARPPASARVLDVEVLDVEGLLVAPGLIDLQCNGAAGIDLRSEPERLWELASVLPRWGVTSWLPTIVTSPPDVVARARATLAAGPPPGWRGAAPIGLHCEGPFLSPDAAGAHPVDLLRPPRLASVDGWSATGGIAMVTLAPELDGALAVIEALVGRGVVVSVGHSRATAAEVERAVVAGASSVTHLFNAMSPLHHREPGVAGVAMSDERLTVGLIADGLHVDPSVVAIAERAVGDRLVLVSDAVALLGVDGVDVSDGVRLRDGTLAGSVLPLIDAVANLVAFSRCTPERAVMAASTRPAAALGAHDRGTLEAGSRGDVVVVTPDLRLHTTIVGGAVLHRAPGRGRP